MPYANRYKSKTRLRLAVSPIPVFVYDGIERVHDGPYGDGLISKFEKQDKPRLAVSVDMLDTGIDVPEVVNLVFMKPAVRKTSFVSPGCITNHRVGPVPYR